MGGDVRRILLAVKAKLRQGGAAPCLVFLGWGVFCVAQEAPVLRMSGIYLREPAMWAGAGALWYVYVGQKNGSAGMVARFATHVLLLVSVTAANLACLGIANLVAGGVVPGRSMVIDAAWFLLALAPVGLALAVGGGRQSANEPQTPVGTILVALSIGPASAILAAPWLADDGASLAAATGLSICASLLRMIATSGEPPVWTPARKQT